MKNNIKIWIPVIVAIISGIFLITKVWLEKRNDFDEESEKTAIKNFEALYPILLNKATRNLDYQKVEEFATGDFLKVNKGYLDELKQYNVTVQYQYELFNIENIEIVSINNELRANVKIKIKRTEQIFDSTGKNIRCNFIEANSIQFLQKSSKGWLIYALKKEGNIIKKIIPCEN